MRYWYILLIFCCINYQAMSAQIDKPKVVIFTTGGTIASINGQPMIDGPVLVQAVPEILDFAEVEVIEFSKIGSSQMTPTHWLNLSKKVNQVLS